MWPPCFVLPHCNTFTDVEDVKFVINYDYPNSSEDYIHRIGRTARSQKTGTAYTFFTPNNMKQAADLVSVLREANQAINPKLIQMAEDRGGETPGLSLGGWGGGSQGPPSCRLVSVVQVEAEGGEVASRMIGVIGIQGAGGAAMAVAATGTVIGVLVGGRRAASAALRSRTVAAVEGTAVTPAAATEAAVMAAVTDRDILELQPIRWVPSVTRASRAPPSSGACRGRLKTE